MANLNVVFVVNYSASFLGFNPTRNPILSSKKRFFTALNQLEALRLDNLFGHDITSDR